MKWKWRNDRRSERNLCKLRGHGFKPRWSPEFFFFFRLLYAICINCVHCDDHFFMFISFPQFIYDLFHISLTVMWKLLSSKNGTIGSKSTKESFPTHNTAALPLVAVGQLTRLASITVFLISFAFWFNLSSFSFNSFSSLSISFLLSSMSMAASQLLTSICSSGNSCKNEY